MEDGNREEERATRGPGQDLILDTWSFSLNFTLPANTTSSPVVTDGKGTDCGPSLGLAAGIPSLVATALLVALLFTLIHRRSSSKFSGDQTQNSRATLTHIQPEAMGVMQPYRVISVF
ncbi:hypothetical protein MJG53_018711 [Ovis ammon polii x Ovis aries]|uniref:Uncharacterized protein n=1 Tax=Ovis ammon polii x Ovis aries TaxID=2918886 RepID=A0ACB9U588_9CETA|nr:hypothetical protein MJG53_018711 [Ovis ammon polii x Ovis aries]